MALTIVRKIKQEKADEHRKIDVNIELMLQKMFYLCNKIIDSGQLIVEKIDFINLFNEEDEEKFEIELAKIQKIINVFTIVFGKKFSVLEAIMKATAMIEKIKKIADNFGVSLITDEDKNTERLSYWTDDDIKMFRQMVRDFGFDDMVEEKTTREKQRILQEKARKDREFHLENDIVYEIYDENKWSKQEIENEARKSQKNEDVKDVKIIKDDELNEHQCDLKYKHGICYDPTCNYYNKELYKQQSQQQINNIKTENEDIFKDNDEDCENKDEEKYEDEIKYNDKNNYAPNNSPKIFDG